MPSVDYVLVFSTSATYSPVRSFGQDSEQKVRQLRQTQLKEEYNKLVTTLKTADLDVTGRSGAPGTETLLLFVKASEKRIREEATRERMSDWLHGVASPAPSPREPSDFASHPIAEAERLRLVYSILTSPRTAEAASIRSSASTGFTCGLPVASQLPPSPTSKAEFPHLLDIFPPHNTIYNKQWLSRWTHPFDKNSTSFASSKNPLDLLNIPQNELDELKNKQGAKVALYFAFLSFYFRSLAFPAIFGTAMWLLGLPFHPLVGLGFVGWSVVFIESWRLREKALAVAWGCYNFDRVEQDRPGFVGDGQEIDPATGAIREKWRFRQTLSRGLASIPALAVFTSLLVAIVSGIYVVETVFNEVYDGPATIKKVLTLVPTVLFVTLVPQVTALWHFVATKLTNYENHRHSTEYETSLTIKTFAISFFSAYGNLLLTSFVYIPYGSFLVPHILSLLPSHHAAALSASTASSLESGSFSINSHKLKTQLFAYTLTNQITGAFLEVGLPYLESRFLPVVQEKLHGAASPKTNSPSAAKFDQAEHADEKDFLERIRKEQLLPKPDISSEYIEMVIQFGYIVLFAVIWPVAPVFSLVNNFFELRSDAFKLTSQTQRAIPSRAESVGPWLEVLGFLSYLGTLTTTALVYLYELQVTYPGKTAEFISNHTNLNATLPANGSTSFFTTRLSAAQSVSLPPPHSAPDLLGALPPSPSSPLTLDAIKSTLFTALVFALLASHAYVLARVLTRWLLTRLEWDGSVAQQLIRRRELELKRAWLDEHGMRLSPREIADKALKWRGMSLGEEEKRGEMAQGYHVAAVGSPADAAFDAEGGGEFWKREDDGKRLIDAVNKEE